MIWHFSPIPSYSRIENYLWWFLARCNALLRIDYRYHLTLDGIGRLYRLGNLHLCLEIRRNPTFPNDGYLGMDFRRRSTVQGVSKGWCTVFAVYWCVFRCSVLEDDSGDKDEASYHTKSIILDLWKYTRTSNGREHENISVYNEGRRRPRTHMHLHKYNFSSSVWTGGRSTTYPSDTHAHEAQNTISALGDSKLRLRLLYVNLNPRKFIELKLEITKHWCWWLRWLDMSLCVGFYDLEKGECVRCY